MSAARYGMHASNEGSPSASSRKATKIRIGMLQAIEANQRQKLPEAIFLRGFVRAYAREVGLHPEDTVRRYLGQFEPVRHIVEVAPSGPNEAQAERVSRSPWGNRSG